MRVVLDALQHRNPSCKRQAERVAELAEWGAEIRIYSPPGGCFAAMHSKVFIIDEQILFTGSVNLTHHGLDKNEENLLVTSSPGAVRAAVSRFEETWALSQVLGQEELRAAAAEQAAKRSINKVPGHKTEVEKMD